jgi:hypothetical protein
MSLIITLEELEDGQILAEPLINRYGQTIMPAGAKLLKSYANKLKTWDITTISIVVSQAEELDLNIPDEVVKSATEIFLSRCPWKPENNYEKELINIGIYYTAKQIMKGDS